MPPALQVSPLDDAAVGDVFCLQVDVLGQAHCRIEAVTARTRTVYAVEQSGRKIRRHKGGWYFDYGPYGLLEIISAEKC
ncbi:MAG: hypothetical protein COT81_04170 [Candidatus Buchananbacteria bacterium CG10_big_fil_rev_8_21_14_0_10_42_9]|uniref:Uncharacterized protein n=1 Tax=Candidatus Buchananbacteria bacterium CG10_big_fil_rev_8_21_14_0_10_42_9 TaxID=1974526 RepID=A0A2H0W0E6_9BACT|nr:MAG: hypothetical protein COT81_04170 [Candidatus Buchananbacteria bacterium CG10_big_fil_rev_8_21_14_0_10_42_9]